MRQSGAEAPEGPATLYSMRLSDSAPRMLYQWKAFDGPAIGHVNDEYVYLFDSNIPPSRIPIAGGKPEALTRFRDIVGWQFHGDDFWFQLSESNAEPSGIYRLDARAPMPMETLVGESQHVLEWTLTPQFIFTAAIGGLDRYATDASSEAEGARIFNLPEREGTGSRIQFSRQDGDFVYFRARLDDTFFRPIRRLNLHTSQVDAISCERKYTSFITSTDEYYYWIERRDEKPSAEDGLYRIAKP